MTAVPRLDDREDLDEAVYPHGSQKRQDEVNRTVNPEREAARRAEKVRQEKEEADAVAEFLANRKAASAKVPEAEWNAGQ
jgi:hypothetical protein